jgi:putative transposase
MQGPRRKQIRLKDFDYSGIGAYFVTIVTKNHRCLFGEIRDGKVILSRIGEKAKEFWKEIPIHFCTIELDEFIIMPNHIHGILSISEAVGLGKRRGVQLNAPTQKEFSRISPKCNTISVVIRTFKGTVTAWCKKQAINYFGWQRGYYDHVVRNKAELQRIRKYIDNNLPKWSLDRENLESRHYMQNHDAYWKGVYDL